jgi:hypothetical protein
MTKTLNKRRYLVTVMVLFIIAALAVTLVRFWRYSPYQLTNNIVGNPKTILSVKNVEVIGRSDGKKIWSFKARQADVSRGRYRTELSFITDGKLFSDGKPVEKPYTTHLRTMSKLQKGLR